MTTELTAKPAELLNSVVFGEQHWQWNCKWSWKYCRTRRLIGSKSCTFLLSRLLFFCLYASFCFISPAIINTRTQPSSCKEMEVLLGRRLWNPGVCLHTNFASENETTTASWHLLFFVLLYRLGLMYLYSHFFKWLHFVYSGGNASKLVPFDRPSYY